MPEKQMTKQMTIEEFGRLVKQKYPQYQNLSDVEVGQKVLEKYPVYRKYVVEGPKRISFLSVSTTVPTTTKTTTPAVRERAFYEKVAEPIYRLGTTILPGAKPVGKTLSLLAYKFTPRFRELEKKIKEGTASSMDYAEYAAILEEVPSLKQRVGGMLDIALSGLLPGIPAKGALVAKGIKGFGARTLLSTGIGASFGLSRALQEPKTDTDKVLKTMATYGIGAGLFSAGLEGTLFALKKVAESIPSIANFFTRLPKSLFERHFKHPKGTKEALRWMKKVSKKPEEGYKYLKTDAIKSVLNDLKGKARGWAGILKTNKEAVTKLGNIEKEIVQQGKRFSSINEFEKYLKKKLGRRLVRYFGTRLKESVDTIRRVSETDPEAVFRVILPPRKITGPEPVIIEEMRSMVRDLRKTTSQQYDTVMKSILEKNKGKTVKIPKFLKSLLQKINQDFKLKYYPKSLDKPGYEHLTFKELNNLFKELNRLKSKTRIATGAEGINVRRAHDLLKNLMVKNLGTEYANLLKDYSTRVEVIDGIDDYIYAWARDNPKKLESATRAIKNAFTDNRWGYIRMLEDLEKLTGRKIVDTLAAYETLPILPERLGELGFGELFRFLLFPLTSPRVVAAGARLAGRFTQAVPKILTSPFRWMATGLISK